MRFGHPDTIEPSTLFSFIRPHVEQPCRDRGATDAPLRQELCLALRARNWTNFLTAHYPRQPFGGGGVVGPSGRRAAAAQPSK